MKTDLKFTSRRSVHGDIPSAFVLGRDQPPLRLLVSREHLIEGPATRLLDEFVTHPDLDVTLSQKDGEDRIIFGERIAGALDVLRAEIMTDSGIRDIGIPFAGQWYNRARKPTPRETRNLPPGPWANEEHRLKQYLLAQVAERLETDLLVTDDPFLLNLRLPSYARFNILSSIDAVAIIGSYLRSRHYFKVQHGQPFTINLRGSGFYWVLARSLLPNGWRWFSAICAGDNSDDRDLTGLGQSALKRVAQALRARDHVHWQLFQPHAFETADEAMFYFDMMLFSLSAAFGVIARLADVALGLNSDPRSISWRDWRKKTGWRVWKLWRKKPGWRVRLQKASPELHEAMAPGSPHAQVHEVLSLLRNSIHGEALNTLAVKRGTRKPMEHLLVLPPADRGKLKPLLAQLGGLEQWGYEDLADLYACVKPGMATEQLLPRAVAALDELMALTPVEELPDLPTDAELMTGPPEDEALWSEDMRRRIQLFSGL